MNDLITAVTGQVKEKVCAHLSQLALCELASVTVMQSMALEITRAVARGVFDAWVEVVVRTGRELFGPCPHCGRMRACKRQASRHLRVAVLGFEVCLPDLRLQCRRCGAKALSLTRLLTGLSSGEASLELKLRAAYSAARHSYGEACRDLQVHYGQSIERAKLRRMVLQVEKEAMRYVEVQRTAALTRVASERRTGGPDQLLLEADGGKVRTGELLVCEEGDPGCGQTTLKRGIPKRKRPAQWREIITFDIRRPGQVEASALDVLVPVTAPEGERPRRMLALAARQGLGDNTAVLGLGDMGSGLGRSFDEAFVGQPRTYWLADWKHTKDYIYAVRQVLRRTDTAAWDQAMRQAIWDRDQSTKEALLAQAKAHRQKKLPATVEKCPVAALATYLANNWKHMRHAQTKAAGLPIVSARAEAQVRDRTKDRFSVPGAWRLENLEPKATLRSIIAEGNWESFRTAILRAHQTAFSAQLCARIQTAIAQRRTDPHSLSRLTTTASEPITHHPEALAA